MNITLNMNKSNSAIISRYYEQELLEAQFEHVKHTPVLINMVDPHILHGS